MDHEVSENNSMDASASPPQFTSLLSWSAWLARACAADVDALSSSEQLSATERATTLAHLADVQAACVRAQKLVVQQLTASLDS